MTKMILGTTLELMLACGALSAQTPIEAAKNTPQITQQVFSDYLSGYDTHNVVSHLQNTQDLLKRSVHDAKLSNLLSYLDVCIEDLGRAVKLPATDTNTHHIDDLLQAIAEGNRFIINALSKHSLVVATR